MTGRADIRRFTEDDVTAEDVGKEVGRCCRLTIIARETKTRKTKKSPGWLKRLESFSKALP